MIDQNFRERAVFKVFMKYQPTGLILRIFGMCKIMNENSVIK